MELASKYNPADVEGKWYQYWLDNKLFSSKPDGREPYTVVIPPPNVTGVLHMGHMLNNTIQDILIRRARMEGKNACWVPGTDHASIATEAKVVNKLAGQGIKKTDLTRDEFLKHAWDWTEEHGGIILKQLRKLGASCDWDRTAFTMDEERSESVIKVFVDLYNKGLIYRGVRMVNWDPKALTALSDEEVIYKEEHSKLYYLRYKVEGDAEGRYAVVATTRPETIMGDTAMCINPNDPKNQWLKGKKVIVPLVNRVIPVIEDDYVDIEFGTGCLKVTPAHDVNDYMLGEKYNLPSIDIFNDNGTLSEAAGLYVGMDRFDVRKQIEEDLQAAGLLEKVEAYTNKVGFSERTNVAIEPKLSMQWFLKMQHFADMALPPVMNDELKFYPAKYKNTYKNWLENIKDWCISRQLWWGHRIPVWYCRDCGETICSVETPKTCTKCGSGHLEQEEDVLDTWFSSALWPFSTLGWPDATEDFRYFYPTDVLVTGYDIIPFWVMRMMFSGIEQTEKVPFHDVLIHGLVRDEQGRKMSKTLGNGIDPLEVIEKYGTDSLRLALLTGIAAGNDSRFTDTKVEAARNFINKLWNAARFVLLNVKDKKVPKLEEIKLQPVDRWIISRLMSTIREVTLSLQKYDLGIAADKLTDFVWNDFCDWYIELSKPALYGEDAEKNRNALGVLLFVLENIVKLLHPFIPFVTEEIYSYLPNVKGSVMTADYPRYNMKLSYKKEAKTFEGIIDLVKTVRAVKVTVNCPAAKKVRLFLVTDSKRLVSVNKGSLMRLAGLSGIEFIANGNEVEGKTVSQVCDLGQFFIPLGEMVNIEEEKKRLEKELDRIMGEISRAGGKLANNNFVAKAPKNLVDAEREKLDKYVDMKKKLEKQIQELEN